MRPALSSKASLRFYTDASRHTARLADGFSLERLKPENSENAGSGFNKGHPAPQGETPALPSNAAAKPKRRFASCVFLTGFKSHRKAFRISARKKAWGGALSGLAAFALKPQRNVDEVTSDLVFPIGGHIDPYTGCNDYTLRIEAEFTEQFTQYIQGQGPGGETLAGGDGILSIQAQSLAQNALEKIDGAIIKKDTIRAHLDAMQNRLENTAANLSIQAESLQASKSQSRMRTWPWR